MDSGNLQNASRLIADADAIIIAASNGFDIADGYNQFSFDETFSRQFGDFARAFGLTSLLQGLLSRWPDASTRWAFLSRLIDYGYASYEPSPAMHALDTLTSDVPRFVVTCNCNSRFLKAGFSEDEIYETEGSYVRLRCSDACTNETYDALSFLNTTSESPDGISMPEKLLPRCPHCAAILDVAVDDTGQLQNVEPFCSQRLHFENFLAAYANKQILVLELGVGQRNIAIKQPLMAYALQASHASYLVLNREKAMLPDIANGQAASLQGDLAETLLALVHMSE